uniref:pre-mRNA 3' end processing protein WDR33-like isoform X2 n=1 Tax=Myxine glutinosa TaxID=7769 RepID=UPI00358E2772
MAVEMTSPQRFFHMPKFQHQGPKQLVYKRPDFGQQDMGQQITFDGKRMRRSVNRKTIDYNSSIVKYLENRVWQRDSRDMRAIQPDPSYYGDLVPPMGMMNNPINAVTTKFVRTSTNKVRCPVFVVRWTPEGRRLVTGASSGEFTLWNGLAFNFETILQAHDTSVRAMTWSHNDLWMLTADHGGFVKYWQSNMNNVKMFQAHKEPIREASFAPTDNKFATCSDDGTVRIWDFLRCHEERILRGHGADVKCLDWHPSKGLLVSGSKDSQQPIKFWDPKSGQSLATLHAHKNTVMEVKWNLNGNWLLTASRDHLCKLFDIRNLKEEVQIFRGHKKESTAVAWHPVHEGYFASGGSDGSLLFWHVGVEKEVGGTDVAHEGMIWSLAWHPLGHILCSGSNDHTSKFWTRNRPGDKMRDRYNLNLLPGSMTDEMMAEYDDTEPLSAPAIPGMGIPEQLKQVLEQEQKVKEEACESEPTIPGLDWGVEELIKEQRKHPLKKIPYSKPVPPQFQQAWNQNKVPIMSVGDIKSENEPPANKEQMPFSNPTMGEHVISEHPLHIKMEMPPVGMGLPPPPPFQHGPPNQPQHFNQPSPGPRGHFRHPPPPHHLPPPPLGHMMHGPWVMGSGAPGLGPGGPSLGPGGPGPAPGGPGPGGPGLGPGGPALGPGGSGIGPGGPGVVPVSGPGPGLNIGPGHGPGPGAFGCPQPGLGPTFPGPGMGPSPQGPMHRPPPPQSCPPGRGETPSHGPPIPTPPPPPPQMMPGAIRPPALNQSSVGPPRGEIHPENAHSGSREKEQSTFPGPRDFRDGLNETFEGSGFHGGGSGPDEHGHPPQPHFDGLESRGDQRGPSRPYEGPEFSGGPEFQGHFDRGSFHHGSRGRGYDGPGRFEGSGGRGGRRFPGGFDYRGPRGSRGFRGGRGPRQDGFDNRPRPERHSGQVDFKEDYPYRRTRPCASGSAGKAVFPSSPRHQKYEQDECYGPGLPDFEARHEDGWRRTLPPGPGEEPWRGHAEEGWRRHGTSSRDFPPPPGEFDEASRRREGVSRDVRRPPDMERHRDDRFDAGKEPFKMPFDGDHRRGPGVRHGHDGGAPEPFVEGFRRGGQGQHQQFEEDSRSRGRDQPPHRGGEDCRLDSPSAAGHERPPSLLTMDTTPLRKRPWHDGPSLRRDTEPPMGPDDRRGHGGGGPLMRSRGQGSHDDDFHGEEESSGPPLQFMSPRGPGRTSPDWGIQQGRRGGVRGGRDSAVPRGGRGVRGR